MKPDIPPPFGITVAEEPQSTYDRKNSDPDLNEAQLSSSEEEGKDKIIAEPIAEQPTIFAPAPEPDVSISDRYFTVTDNVNAPDAAPAQVVVLDAEPAE